MSDSYTNDAVDFKIDNDGDLIFNNIPNNNKFMLKFNISDISQFRIKINSNPTQIMSKDMKKKFHICFKTKNIDTSKNKCSANIVSGIEEISQLIEIRLKTSEKEAGRESLDSSLQKLKHTFFVDSEDLFSRIESAVKEKIDDIVTNANVHVEYKKGNGNFYCQNINIYIYNENGILIYKYTI